MNILVIDDDSIITDTFDLILHKNHSLTLVNSIEQIPNTTNSFDAVFTDIHLTNNFNKTEGIDVIKGISKKNPKLEIIAMSGVLEQEIMEACLVAGASRFVAKPLHKDELLLIIEKIEAFKLLQLASRRGQKKVSWIGSSAPSEKIKKQVAQLAGEQGVILIEGETGTGKEIVSQLLHQQLPDRPFISLNIAALPENLFESELFGHVKGAFTGADQNKMGLAEAAHGGDLFLDEIEALSLSMQVKLLRFLESGELRRVGSNITLQVKCRVIIATNKNLQKMVQKNEFREDLLWRINGKKINLPPLRERKSDLAELCQFFLSQETFRSKTLNPSALDALESYSWPGNVRELKRICEQLVFSSPLPIIRDTDINNILQIKQNSSFKQDKPLDFSRGLNVLMSDYEKGIIEKTLELKNNLDEVAILLKVSRSNLYKKISDHQIKWKN